MKTTTQVLLRLQYFRFDFFRIKELDEKIYCYAGNACNGLADGEENK